jgi:hypothetical protein
VKTTAPLVPGLAPEIELVSWPSVAGWPTVAKYGILAVAVTLVLRGPQERPERIHYVASFLRLSIVV